MCRMNRSSSSSHHATLQGRSQRCCHPRSDLFRCCVLRSPEFLGIYLRPSRDDIHVSMMSPVTRCRGWMDGSLALPQAPRSGPGQLGSVRRSGTRTPTQCGKDRASCGTGEGMCKITSGKHAASSVSLPDTALRIGALRPITWLDHLFADAPGNHGNGPSLCLSD